MRHLTTAFFAVAGMFCALAIAIANAAGHLARYEWAIPYLGAVVGLCIISGVSLSVWRYDRDKTTSSTPRPKDRTTIAKPKSWERARSLIVAFLFFFLLVWSFSITVENSYLKRVWARYGVPVAEYGPVPLTNPVTYHVTAAGELYLSKSNSHKLAAVVFQSSGLIDEKDVDSLQKSSLYDIQDGPIDIRIPVDVQFVAQNQRGIQTHYMLLLVPSAVPMSDVKTVRQAEREGVEVLWGGWCGKF